MAEVLIQFECSACGKKSDPPFRTTSSWFPKRDYLEVMKARGWKVTRRNAVLCKECNVDRLAHGRTIDEEIRERRLQLKDEA